MGKKTKEITVIGTLVIVLALVSTFYASDYREVLLEYSDKELILITGMTDKIELLGRSHDESVEFYRWKYEDGVAKAYLGSRDLIDTSYWRVYEGSKLVKGAYDDQISYKYNDNSATILMDRLIYYDSHKTRYAGWLEREIEIYPNTNKETIRWYPENTSIKYNLQWVHETDDYEQRGKLNGTRVDLEKMQISWEDSKDQVSSAYRYLNGKVNIRYKSATGIQVIDPTITLGSLIIEYWQEDYGDRTYTPYCIENCNLPIAITFNKNKLINDPTELTGKFIKKNEVSKGLKDWGIEFGSNVSYDVPVWVSNIICENESIIDINGTYDVENCTDFGGLEQITKYKIVWSNVSFPVSVSKDVIYHINIWGVKHIEEGNDIDAVASILGIDLYKLAWWNSDYPSKYPMYVSDDYQSTMPYPINLSTVYLNGSTAQIMWANAPNESYLYENGESVYAVVNSAEDTQLNMTNETSIAQASYGILWDGMNELQARYDMNCNAIDSTSNSHDGNVDGATCTEDGFINGAYSFDGANDEITLTDIDLGASGTIEVRIRIEDDNLNPILVKRFGTNNDYYVNYYLWYYQVDDSIRLTIGTGSAFYCDPAIVSDAVAQNTWYHVVGTWNATGCYLYIDGIINKSSGKSGSVYNHNDNAKLGGSQDATETQFKGKIDEVRLLNRAITALEVKASFESLTIGTLGTKEDLTTYDLVGIVKDSNDVAVENATVIIINQATDTITGTATSNSTGGWTYEVANTGTYLITAYNPDNSTQDGDCDPHVVVS